MNHAFPRKGVLTKLLTPSAPMIALTWSSSPVDNFTVAPVHAINRLSDGTLQGISSPYRPMYKSTVSSSKYSINQGNPGHGVSCLQSEHITAQSLNPHASGNGQLCRRTCLCLLHAGCMHPKSNVFLRQLSKQGLQDSAAIDTVEFVRAAHAFLFIVATHNRKVLSRVKSHPAKRAAVSEYAKRVCLHNPLAL